MAFIDNVLQAPSYGWKNQNGDLVIPSNKQLVSELFSRINIFKSKKNWISLVGWFWVLCLLPFFVTFVVKYLSWPLVGAFFLYTMIIMSTQATIWYHRYCTHKAFTFSNPIWKFITQNLVVKVIPEEMYVVSHHVHHSKSDLPGDPYNSTAGLMYCMLADTNHQGINKEMSESDYKKAANFLEHTGIYINSYQQYQKWGSIAHPLHTLILWVFNWTFWYTAFYFIGGHGLACALFGSAMVWVIGVRAFNYTGHGKGKESHKDGIDFDRSNLSINQIRPGLFAGEWHNNHHLYPASARAGFLPYQLDLAWYYIYTLYKIGGVKTYHNSKKMFYANYINKVA
jgi:sn-1 stearoyl-lipid 9-desaturase